MDKALAIKHGFDSVFLFNGFQRLAKNIFQRVYVKMIVNVEFSLFKILIAIQSFYILFIQFNTVFFLHALHFISFSFNFLNGSEVSWNVAAVCRNMNAKPLVLAKQVQIQCS